MATIKNGHERKKTKAKVGSKTTLIDLKKQLLDSVTQCKPKIVKRLLDAKVDPNCVNELGETPLVIACQLENEEARRKISSLLLKSNSSVHTQDISGNTALSSAIKTVDEELVKVLLEKGADVSQATAEGNTTLCCAALSGSPGITKLVLKEVLKQRLPVDHKNMHGLTPLLLAAQADHLEVARILVRDGKASVRIRDLDNFMTAEQWMKHAGFHTAQEIAFLSPKSKHRRKAGVKSLLDSVKDLDSESTPDLSATLMQRHKSSLSSASAVSGGFSLPQIQSQVSSSPLHQAGGDSSSRSMFDLPKTSTHESTASATMPMIDEKFRTEQLPTTRVSKQDIFSSSFLNKRKSMVGHNKKSKFYATGSLEPLTMDNINSSPPSLKRMNSILETSTNENSNPDNRSITKLPPLNK